jgi:hypothetical protein
MSKWDELKKWAQDYQDWNDVPELREVLNKMAKLEEQDDGSEDLESRSTFEDENVCFLPWYTTTTSKPGEGDDE